MWRYKRPLLTDDTVPHHLTTFSNNEDRDCTPIPHRCSAAMLNKNCFEKPSKEKGTRSQFPICRAENTKSKEDCTHQHCIAAIWNRDMRIWNLKEDLNLEKVLNQRPNNCGEDTIPATPCRHQLTFSFSVFMRGWLQITSFLTI